MQNLQTKLPAISVLLPVHNGEDELLETVEYIFNQTFSDFELLILDDASTDGTWKLMQQLSARDPRVRVFQVAENIGIVKALNKLAGEARGSIFIREDCGDVSHPERYALQYEALTANPGASLCVGDYWRLDVDGTPVALVQIPTTSEEISEQLATTNDLAHASFAIPRKAFEQVKGYDPALYCSQDYDLVLKLLKVGPIVPLNVPLIGMRYNPTGISFRNAARQAAFAELIRSRHFGTEPPERTDYAPLSPEETKAKYHQIVGKLHLVKGRPHLARLHFRAAYASKPELTPLVGLTLACLPSWIIRSIRTVRGKTAEDELDYFAETG